MIDLGRMTRVVVALGLVAAAPAAAREWHRVTKANYGEFSVDTKGAAWTKRVVT